MANQADLVNCDERLAGLLGDKVIKLSSLSERIGHMLTRVPTPVLEYTIRSAAFHPSHAHPRPVHYSIIKTQW